MSQARWVRLKAERQLLAQRERVLELAWENLRLDEALLERQRTQWSLAWQAWVKCGGSIRHAVLVGRDKVLLSEMAALLAQRRAELQSRADRLAADTASWALRLRVAQQFDEHLVERGRGLRGAEERAVERQRDEESLLALADGRAAVRAPHVRQRQ